MHDARRHGGQREEPWRYPAWLWLLVLPPASHEALGEWLNLSELQFSYWREKLHSEEPVKQYLWNDQHKNMTLLREVILSLYPSPCSPRPRPSLTCLYHWKVLEQLIWWGLVGGGEGREEGWFFLYTKKQKADLNSSVFKNDRKGLLSWERKLGESKQELQRLCQSVVMPSFSTQQRQKSGSLCDVLWLLPIHCH